MIHHTSSAKSRTAKVLFRALVLWGIVWMLFLSRVAASQALGRPRNAALTSSHRVALSIVTRKYFPVILRSWAGGVVNIQDRQTALEFFNDQYRSSEDTALSWSGNHGACDAGSVNQSFQEAVLRRINYFRAMAGVPARVTFSEEFNRKAQAAVLMMSVNRQLDHTPPKSWVCYTVAGAQAAGSSNLSLGTFGWDAISGQMMDPGTNNYVAGHRRWILYPQTEKMGTGNIPASAGYPPANVLWVFDPHMWEARPPTREAFVAWPPPGYVPHQVVFPRWSFSYAGADFSSASVVMTSNGAPVRLKTEPVVDGYGENTLVWILLGLSDGASWPRPDADTRYAVTINNIDIDGQRRSYSYDVIIFDPNPQGRLEKQSILDVPIVKEQWSAIER